MYKELTISGNFTIEEALKYKVRLHKMATENESLVIDLRNTESADVVGVNLLATTHKILKDRGQKLAIKVAPNSELMTLLQLTKFTEILEIN
jgi:anti-anti-sigma regulatory factor